MTAIRPFQATDSDYTNYVALKRAVWVDQPATVEAQRGADAQLDPALLNRRDLLMSPDGDRAVGAVDYYHRAFAYHPQHFGFMIIVHPDWRRRGLGNRLYSHVLAALEPHDPLSLESAAYEGEPAGIGFLEHRGFELKVRHQISELDPARFDPAPFAGVLDSVARSGIQIRTLRQVRADTADPVSKLYALAEELSRDAPWYEAVSKPPLEQWRRQYIDGPTVLPDGFLIAIDGDDFVGQSALMADVADDGILQTGLTGVIRKYRRHGIATALKVRAIQHAQTRRSSRDRCPLIRTGNAEENPMLQLNLQLGFRPRPAWRIYGQQVAPDAGPTPQADLDR